MLVEISIPDSFQSIIRAKTEAELSTLLQTALLSPSLLGSIKGLQIDSLIILDYLERILETSKSAPVVQVTRARDEPNFEVPDLDLTLAPTEDSLDDSDDSFEFDGLINFLGG